jgi:hypothetical protein
MKARILVLNGFVKGWNVLKSLADDGFEVNCGHHTPDAPGLFSNRVGDRSGNLVYPDPKADERGFVDAVLDHIGRVKFDIVLPVNAAEMMALARHKDRVSGFALFPFENYYKLLLLHDKKYFFELMAAQSDQDILPRSWSIGNQTPPIGDVIGKAGIGQTAFQPMDDYLTVEHFLNAHPGIIYPLMVKTRRATSAVGIYRVRDETELRTACRILGDVDIIVQEILTGRGVGISFVRWDQPSLTYHFGHKRVREYPISGGASTSREPWACDDHPLTAATSHLLDRLDWHGVVMFELKEIDGGGTRTYKFLEANPRFWGSVPLAIVNGVNFPALLCRAALGMNHPPVHNLNRYRARIFFSDTLSMVLNVLHGRRVWYNLGDYFNFRRLKLDDIDFGDFPATRKIFRRMTTEFLSRLRKRPR